MKKKELRKEIEELKRKLRTVAMEPDSTEAHTIIETEKYIFGIESIAMFSGPYESLHEFTGLINSINNR